MFTSWRKISENSGIVLQYGLDLIVNDFFPKNRFKRVNCFLEVVKITFYKIGKEVFTERCESPSSFTPSRFKSEVGAELEEGISMAEGVQEGSLGILDLKGKMFSK